MNRDEDLILFRDMCKREKKDLASLLLPVPDEFEANGNYALYRMASGKKGQVGLDYMSTETGKNDYDWLKTPPATPLFPSLDMEANAPELVIQKEIPIIQPVITVSRFADKTGAAKTRSTLIKTASPNQKPKIATSNSTQIGKQSASSIEKKNTTYAATTKMIKSNTSNDHKERSDTLPSITTRTTKQKDTSLNFLASNLSKTLGMESSSSTTRPKSRGVSPAGRPKILGAQFPGFSDETLPNLKTDRSLSANRGRPIHQNQSTNQRPGSSSLLSSSTTKPKSRGVSPAGRPKILGAQFPGFSDETPSNLRTDRSLSANRGRPNQSTNQRPGSSSSLSSSSSSVPITKSIRRESCSPSVTRGRKQEVNLSSTKFQQGNGTTQVLGSRMVDKFLSARKSAHEEKEINKAKLNGSLNESSGLGRHISRISANVALNHMETHQDSGNSFKNGTATGRKSSNIRGSRMPSA